MPTKLKNLKVTSVDFVNAGANPGAKISIFKSANQKDCTAELAALAKASGVEQEKITKVLINAGLIKAVADVEKADKTNKEDKGEPIPDSPEDSAEKLVDEEFRELAEKETEGKKMAKQLNETERLILKNFSEGYDKQEIAKCLGFNIILSNAEGTLAIDAGAVNENKQDTVQTETLPLDAGIDDAEKCGGLKKSADNDEVKKSTETPAATGLTKILADLTGKLQSKVEKAEDKEFEDIAKKYEILGYKAEELAKELKKGKSESPALYDTVIKALDSAVDAVEKSDVFNEIGKCGSGFVGNAEAQIESLAAEIRKSNPAISYHKAKDMVFQTHPELISAFDN